MNDFYNQSLDPDPFNMHDWGTKFIRQVNETEEEFIFTTIQPFLNKTYNRVVSKQELIAALSLLRMCDESDKKYGYHITIGEAWTTATQQSYALNQAYNNGFKNGVDSVHEKLRNDILEEN